MKVKGQRRKFALTSRFLFLPFAFLLFTLAAAAQRIAVVTPDKAEASIRFAGKLETSLEDRVKILDDSLSESAYASASPATPFNLTTEESKRIGSAIGCEFLILLKSATQRRSAFQRAEYYESYAVIYVVSSRTGRLVWWKLPRLEAPKADKAATMLDESIPTLAAGIESAIRNATKFEISESDPPIMEEVPEANSAEAKNFRAPVPYRRLKPEYTADAATFDVKATVDILVDLNAAGTITRTEIVRWAGYGLDESVDKAVRTMNWRPAMRNGKPLPMRFLLRYNFKKLDKE